MSEAAKCVCGHARSQHHRNVGTGCMMDDCWTKEGQTCKEFRPVLSWPDSPGWWWITSTKGPPPDGGNLVYCYKEQDEWGVFFIGSEYGSRKGSRDLRFTRLLESNPFAQPPQPGGKE